MLFVAKGRFYAKVIVVATILRVWRNNVSHT